MLRRIACLVLLLAASWSVVPDAQAAWQTQSPGTAVPRAVSMPTGPMPTTTVVNVLGTGYVYTLSWPTITVQGNTPVSGYRITRASLSGAILGIGSCSGVTVVSGVPTYVPATAGTQQSCTDVSAVPLGQVRYTVTPIYGRWIGPASAWSPSIN